MILDRSKLKKIKGDASFRSFYRKKLDNKIDLFFEYGEDLNKRFLSIKGLNGKKLNVTK